MELKHGNIIFQAKDGNGFNRTFMELKHEYAMRRKVLNMVLIGPSWN